VSQECTARVAVQLLDTLACAMATPGLQQQLWKGLAECRALLLALAAVLEARLSQAGSSHGHRVFAASVVRQAAGGGMHAAAAVAGFGCVTL
jgi:hypothetical protein